MSENSALEVIVNVSGQKIEWCFYFNNTIYFLNDQTYTCDIFKITEVINRKLKETRNAKILIYNGYYLFKPANSTIEIRDEYVMTGVLLTRLQNWMFGTEGTCNLKGVSRKHFMDVLKKKKQSESYRTIRIDDVFCTIRNHIKEKYPARSSILTDSLSYAIAYFIYKFQGAEMNIEELVI